MKVLVIGGGAAGLTAAIFASKAGAKVTVLEHENKTGKKILTTGNGKCNITNLIMNEDCFYGNKNFIRAVLNQFDENDAINFFKEIGIYTKDKNNYIYPLSEQASTVSNRLREVCEKLGVKIKTNNYITDIKKSGDKFAVDYGFEDVFDKVILATGGKSFPATGSDGSGYEIAKKFGHKIIDTEPALTALVCEKSELNKASGVRVKAQVTLDDTHYDIGEVQIADYGISGIPVFNISRFAKIGSTLLLDFMPEYSLEELIKILYELANMNSSFNLIQILNGLINEKLANAVLEKCNLKKNDDITNKNINLIACTLKSFKLTVKQKKGFDFAQVTMGGVDTNEINSETMESKIVSGLYFVGEIIDIDGRCGGYNLQFAWSSGAIAGRNIC